MTSKLKSSLMLFIFKCSLLDRRHLVWHSSRGRPWCSALHGSITRRQPFCADTKGVGLTRDSLWNLSQSCTTMKKNTIALGSLFTHIQICRDASFPPQHLPSRKIVCPSSSGKWKSIKDLFFFPEINVDAFNVRKVCLLSQMLKHQLYLPDLDDGKLWHKECIKSFNNRITWSNSVCIAMFLWFFLIKPFLVMAPQSTVRWYSKYNPTGSPLGVSPR